MSGSLNSSFDLPWMEDVARIYYYSTFNNTFPKTDFTTMFIAIFHIIGAYMLYLGIFLPPQYIWLHVVYLTIVFTSYFIFDKNCFMTLLANVNTDNIKTPLYIRMTTAIWILVFIYIYALAILFFPQISPYAILKGFFTSY